MLTQPLVGNTPVDTLFRYIQDLPYPVWLDSSDNQDGRYHIISAAPKETLCLEAGEDHHHVSFFNQAQQLLHKYKTSIPQTNLPFQGGLIGFISYELGANALTGNHSCAKDNNVQLPHAPHIAQLPKSYFGLYLWALVVDKQKALSQLVFHPECEDSLKRDLVARFSSSTTSLIREADSKHNSNLSKPFQLTTAFTPTTSDEQYTSDINKILDYIHAGDVYQVNYAQHFSASYNGDTLDAYLALRAAAPAPYSGYLKLDNAALLCHSPEQFLSVNDRAVRTSPIKGTAPRSKNPQSDQHSANILENSEKNRAENLMIVDLMRNDLSKHALPGSVKVPELFNLKSYSNVHHLVSEIIAELKPEATPIDMLASMLPAGSITGAPKKRAVEIISQLENAPRHFYCGNMGYFSLCGKADINIGIRSMVADKDHIHCWGGGGIVAESSAAKEHEETLHKVGGLMAELERLFQQIPFSKP